MNANIDNFSLGCDCTQNDVDQFVDYLTAQGWEIDCDDFSCSVTRNGRGIEEYEWNEALTACFAAPAAPTTFIVHPATGLLFEDSERAYARDGRTLEVVYRSADAPDNAPWFLADEDALRREHPELNLDRLPMVYSPRES